MPSHTDGYIISPFRATPPVQATSWFKKLHSPLVRVGPAGSAAAIGRIEGFTLVDGSPDYPTGQVVRLYHDLTGRFVAQTRSDPLTGAYEFTGLDMNAKYTVVSIYSDHTFNAVISDNLSPVL